MIAALESIVGWVCKSTVFASVLFTAVVVTVKLLKTHLNPSILSTLGLLAIIRFVLPYSPENPISLFNALPDSSATRELTKSNSGTNPSGESSSNSRYPKNLFRPHIAGLLNAHHGADTGSRIRSLHKTQIRNTKENTHDRKIQTGGQNLPPFFLIVGGSYRPHNLHLCSIRR